MTLLKIQQFPDEDVTVIEGTRYGNELLRVMGQNGIAPGPFVICSRGDGTVSIRTVSAWPEVPEPEYVPGSGLAKLRDVNAKLRDHKSKATLYMTAVGVTRSVTVDGHRLENIASASTEHLPGTVSKLTVELYVNEIETVRVADDWWPT